MIEWSKVASDINKYAKSVFREDGQTITDSELEHIDSVDQLAKKGKSLISSKGLDFEHVRETIDTIAKEAAIKDLNECIDMEAKVNHLRNRILYFVITINFVNS